MGSGVTQNCEQNRIQIIYISERIVSLSAQDIVSNSFSNIWLSCWFVKFAIEIYMENVSVWFSVEIL